MDENVTIRRVRARDASRIRALRLEMLADTPLAYVTTLADAAAMPHDEWVGRAARASSGPGNAQFVADAGGRFVGTASGFEHPVDPDRTLLVAVYISPAHRGRGMLADLIETTATWSRETGRRMLELEVVTTNERAIRAYRKLGFVPEGDTIPHPKIASLREQRMVRAA